MTQMYTIHTQELTSADQSDPVEIGVFETNDLSALLALILVNPYHMVLFDRTNSTELTFMIFPSLFHMVAVWATYEARVLDDKHAEAVIRETEAAEKTGK